MIELYTMPLCSGCEAVKKALEADHIPFIEIKLEDIGYGMDSELLADLRISGYHGPIEDLMVAPIARNSATGDAIPASLLCSGDPIRLISEIL